MWLYFNATSRQNFSFTAEQAIIFMPGKDTKSIVDHDINIKHLSPTWIKWAEENDAFIGIGDNRILTQSDIVTDKILSIVSVFLRKELKSNI